MSYGVLHVAWAALGRLGVCVRVQHMISLLPFFMAGLQLKRSSFDSQIVQVPRKRACVCARAFVRVRARVPVSRMHLCAYVRV